MSMESAPHNLTPEVSLIYLRSMILGVCQELTAPVAGEDAYDSYCHDTGSKKEISIRGHHGRWRETAYRRTDAGLSTFVELNSDEEGPVAAQIQVIAPYFTDRKGFARALATITSIYGDGVIERVSELIVEDGDLDEEREFSSNLALKVPAIHFKEYLDRLKPEEWAVRLELLSDETIVPESLDPEATERETNGFGLKLYYREELEPSAEEMSDLLRFLDTLPDAKRILPRVEDWEELIVIE